MNKKIYLIIPVFVLIIIIILAFSFNQKEPETIKEIPLILTETKAEDEIKFIEIKNVINRSKYGINENIFFELPLPPENFYEIKNLATKRKATTQQITKEIYSQPEFYLNWFKNHCLAYYKETKNPIGLGFYPAKKRISLKAGEEFIEWFTVKNICGSRYSQKILLHLTTPKEIKAELSETEFILEPTYPVFKENWSKKIELKVLVDKNASKGTYLISVNPVNSPIELVDKNWFELKVVVE